MADRWDDERYRDEWERGRRYRGEGDYGAYGPPGEREWGRRSGWGRSDYEREHGRGGEYGRRGDWGRRDRDDRGFFDRAGDEIRSWFGDDEAQRRRMRDEREYGREGQGGGYGWPGTSGYGERWGGGPGERRGGSGGRGEERDWARQWGWIDDREVRENPELRRWNRQEGVETRGPLDYGRLGGYGRGRGQGWGEGGYPEAGRRGEPRYGEPRYGEARHDDDWASGESLRYRETWVFVGPFSGFGPRDYQRSDDRIREDICDRMSQHGQLDASNLEVRVSNGEVTLSGSVSDRSAKRLAEDIAESVSGVREVHNQVRLPSAQPGQPGQPGRPQGDERQRAA